MPVGHSQILLTQKMHISMFLAKLYNRLFKWSKHYNNDEVKKLAARHLARCTHQPPPL